jgi:hypothetical protein
MTLSSQDGAGDDASTSLYWSVLCNDNSAWPRGAQPYCDQVAEMVRRATRSRVTF